MVSTKAAADINVRPDELWQLIGGFGSLPDWVPGVSQSKLADGGRVRYLSDPQGQSFVERLETYDSSVHTYTYSILESPIPVSNYLATIAVTPTNGGKQSHVEWYARYIPSGISEEAAGEIFHGIFSAGLQALASRYAMKFGTRDLGGI